MNRGAVRYGTAAGAAAAFAGADAATQGTWKSGTGADGDQVVRA